MQSECNPGLVSSNRMSPVVSRTHNEKNTVFIRLFDREIIYYLWPSKCLRWNYNIIITINSIYMVIWPSKYIVLPFKHTVWYILRSNFRQSSGQQMTVKNGDFFTVICRSVICLSPYFWKYFAIIILRSGQQDSFFLSMHLERNQFRGNKREAILYLIKY